MILEGFLPEKLVCVFNSLDYQTQLKIREQLSPNKIFKDYYKNNNPNLIYIGRLQKVKKIEMIIEAIYNLKILGIECNLVIVGKEIEHLDLYNLISNYNLNNQIWFYGECYDEKKIAELIFNSDVCVSPGNVGLTAIHSLVYGTPVVTHDNFKNQMPEFEAIEDNITGSFFHENSMTHLMEKIKYWISKDSKSKTITREKCFRVIDELYNPFNQLDIIKKVLNSND
jgi:glycosyltransferase involved in cell wall biosynthesis